MADILFVTPYYPPEVGAPQTRISETAIRLARRGHRVSVLTTFPNYPSGIVLSGYRTSRICREVRDGVQIIRVWSYISPKKDFVHRILAQLSFGCLAALIGNRAIGTPDIIIVESPPLFDAIAGRILAWRKRCPYVFTVADLWPEAAVQLGILHNRALIWLAERLEWSTYRKAAAIWALTNTIRHTLIQRGLSPNKVFLMPNSVDTARFQPLSQAHARAELAWDDRFTILHAGTIGLTHGLQTLLDAADLLRTRTDIRIVLVGDGTAKTHLVAEAARRNLQNVTFFDSQPYERMPLVIAASDVCLVGVRKLPINEGVLPTKMSEIMACARPIILAVEGEARRIAEQEAGAALYVEPENAASLTEAILHLHDHPDLCGRLGQNGRSFVVTHFDREHLTTLLEARLTALLARRTSPSLTTHRPIPGTNLDSL